MIGQLFLDTRQFTISLKDLHYFSELALDIIRHMQYMMVSIIFAGTFAPCLGGPWFDSRQTKDSKLIVEAPLSNAQHIHRSSTQKLVDPLPE